MSHSEAVIPAACGCNCQEEEEFARSYMDPQEEEEEQEPENHVLGWPRCECPFCGPLFEDGSRKCKVQISPILMCATAIQSGFPNGEPVPAFCGDCRNHCLFVRRRDAVIRAREARKRQRQGTEAHRSRSRKRQRQGTEAHRSRSRSQKSSY